MQVASWDVSPNIHRIILISLNGDGATSVEFAVFLYKCLKKKH